MSNTIDFSLPVRLMLRRPGFVLSRLEDASGMNDFLRRAWQVGHALRLSFGLAVAAGGAVAMYAGLAIHAWVAICIVPAWALCGAMAMKKFDVVMGTRAASKGIINEMLVEGMGRGMVGGEWMPVLRLQAELAWLGSDAQGKSMLADLLLDRATPACPDQAEAAAPRRF